MSDNQNELYWKVDTLINAIVKGNKNNRYFALCIIFILVSSGIYLSFKLTKTDELNSISFKALQAEKARNKAEIDSISLKQVDLKKELEKSRERYEMLQSRMERLSNVISNQDQQLKTVKKKYETLSNFSNYNADSIYKYFEREFGK